MKKGIAGLVGSKFTVVFFGVRPDVIDACLPIARDLRIARAHAKHLHAACTVLDAFPGAMLVVSTDIRHGERDVIERHAERAKASVLWVGANDDVDHVVTSVASWATAARGTR